MLVIVRYAFIEYLNHSSLFGVLPSIDLQVQQVFLELEMEINLFLEEQRSHLYCEVEKVTFDWGESIGEFADYLVVLLLCGVFEAVYYVQELLVFEKNYLVLLYFGSHLGCLVYVHEFFGVELCELDNVTWLFHLFL